MAVGVDAQGVAQLGLALDHARPYLVGEVADRVAEAPGAVGEPGRGERLRGLGDLAYDEDARRRAERQPEEPPHEAACPRCRRLAFAAARSAFICDLTRFSTCPRERSDRARRTP